jgi:DHA1 family multidrug resistance protein-like MFS transporter
MATSNHPRHPQNWPRVTKLYISAILIFNAFNASFASAIFSAASPFIGQEFGTSREVLVLGTSLYLLGYAFGPIIFAPISELYGRRIPIIGSAFAFGVFNIGVAIAKDIQTVMVCRFFVGLAGSCPLTIVAAIFTDLYSNHFRGAAVATFGATVICGPLLAPSLGGFIAKSYLGWRFTAYIPAFLGFAAATLALLFQKETYGPVILVSKAADLRRRTQNWGIRARQEEVEVDFKELVSQNLSRPLRILFTEPIVLLVTLYSSFLYALLYTSLTAFQLVFAGVHGFGPGNDGLPYYGVLIGALMGYGLLLLDVPRYAKRLTANDNVPVPEWRLPPMMVGGIVFAIG